MMYHDHSDVGILRKEVRTLKLAVICLGTLVAVLLFTAAARQTTFSELSAERIDIVDAAGKPRLVIANAARFPPVLLHGKTYRRAVAPAGMLFFDQAGNEVGGLAVTDLAPGRVLALSFDYTNFDAVGMQTRISPDGKEASAGLVINSRPPEQLEPLAAGKAAVRRVAVENANETAQVVLSDPQGRPRLQLRVDPAGEPRLEMLDDSGKATLTITERGIASEDATP
jgi:hypothetical protein